jgi:hypothetical protein
MHYLLHCRKYKEQRQVFRRELGRKASEPTFLLSNTKALTALFRYIAATKCFDKTFGTEWSCKNDGKTRTHRRTQGVHRIATEDVARKGGELEGWATVKPPGSSFPCRKSKQSFNALEDANDDKGVPPRTARAPPTRNITAYHGHTYRTVPGPDGFRSLGSAWMGEGRMLRTPHINRTCISPNIRYAATGVK